MVTTEDICDRKEKFDESFPPGRVRLDVIAFILGMGGIHNNNNNNNDEAETNLEDEFDTLRETVKELSSGSDIIEDYLSLLQRRGFIEYDYRGNKTFRTTPRGLFILQLYQRVAMWLS